jgi:hypothetical protein
MVSRKCPGRGTLLSAEANLARLWRQHAARAFVLRQGDIMKVFISWSGDRSREIADVFRKWLPSVLQVVRPYFSPDDIAKGARWEGEISKELAASRIGLLILTSENREAPWLIFEAGALAKNLDKSKVCPLLFDLEPTDIKGPLVQFQSAKFSAEEILRVLKMINVELAENGLDNAVLDEVFEMWWPRLESEVAEVLKKSRQEGQARSERDLLEEILALTRSTASVREDRDDINPAAIADMMESFAKLANEIAETGSDRLMDAIIELQKPVEYISKRSKGLRTSRMEFDRAANRLRRRSREDHMEQPPPKDEIPF